MYVYLYIYMSLKKVRVYIYVIIDVPVYNIYICVCICMYIPYMYIVHLHGLQLFSRFSWTCLPRSCVKAEGDLDGLYAAMGLGYFARCAMERAQWGAGQLSRTYDQQGTMAVKHMAMVDGGTDHINLFGG